MSEFKVGDEVTLSNNALPDEPFTIIRFRAHGMLADLESPFQSQILCAPIGALTLIEHEVEGVEPQTRIEDSGLTPTDIALAHEYESEGVEDAQELDPPLKDYPHGFGMPVEGKWEQ